MKTLQEFECPSCGHVNRVEIAAGETREIACGGCYHEEWVPPVWPTMESHPELMVWNEAKGIHVPKEFVENQKKLEHGARFSVIGA